MSGLFDGLPQDLIEKAAARHALDPRLIAAFIRVETSGDPWRNRYELSEKYITHPEIYCHALGIDLKTEFQMQKVSWGYLQVMGYRARELGYRDHLAKLSLPELGLEWGCLSIRMRAAQFHLSSFPDIIAAHNAGSIRRVTPNGPYVNQKYVDAVLSRLAQDA